MISCVVVFDGRVTTVVYDDTHQVCSDPAWNLVRPRSWCWKFISKLRHSRRNGKNWSFVHFSVRWNWIILLSPDCCLSQ